MHARRRVTVRPAVRRPLTGRGGARRGARLGRRRGDRLRLGRVGAPVWRDRGRQRLAIVEARLVPGLHLEHAQALGEVKIHHGGARERRRLRLAKQRRAQVVVALAEERRQLRADAGLARAVGNRGLARRAWTRRHAPGIRRASPRANTTEGTRRPGMGEFPSRLHTGRQSWRQPMRGRRGTDVGICTLRRPLGHGSRRQIMLRSHFNAPIFRLVLRTHVVIIVDPLLALLVQLVILRRGTERLQRQDGHERAAVILPRYGCAHVRKALAALITELHG
mmetsp:Transcript_2497/g.8396  ORF Transcript_2497/g.8396 Transcript_2497/m.8396 type:complete len:278 (+) Transcript_2497:347-1180(+)